MFSDVFTSDANCKNKKYMKTLVCNKFFRTFASIKPCSITESDTITDHIWIILGGNNICLPWQ